MRTRKELFVALGEIGLIDGKKKFIPKSPVYVRDQLSKLPEGKEVAMQISEFTSTRSTAQRAYHWVLMGYLAEYSGCSKEEMHDAVCRIKFGTREVTVGKIKTSVRRSISDAARMSTSDMIELITFDLELCAEMEIHVPTPEELGYISNTKARVK